MSFLGNKDQPNGIPGLDNNGLISIANLPVGTNGSKGIVQGDGITFTIVNGIGSAIGDGSGTVTNFSITNANGFSGSVANPSTTPTLTLQTTFTGIGYSNGTNFAAAIASNFPTLNQSTTGNALTATSATSATTATNLSGVTVNSISYQSAAGITGYIAPVNNAIVVTNVSGVPTESTTLPAGIDISGGLVTDPISNTVKNINAALLAVANAGANSATQYVAPASMNGLNVVYSMLQFDDVTATNTVYQSAVDMESTGVVSIQLTPVSVTPAQTIALAVEMFLFASAGLTAGTIPLTFDYQLQAYNPNTNETDNLGSIQNGSVTITAAQRTTYQFTVNAVSPNVTTDQLYLNITNIAGTTQPQQVGCSLITVLPTIA